MVHMTWATEIAKLAASKPRRTVGSFPAFRLEAELLGFPWSWARLLGKLRASPASAFRL